MSVQSLGFGVEGGRKRVQGSGFRVQDNAPHAVGVEAHEVLV